MKKADSVKSSARARLNEAIRLCDRLKDNLEIIKNAEDLGGMMGIRKDVSRLCQAVHEFNAYETTYRERNLRHWK